MKLGYLEEIDDLRGIWPHEASDFTPWLASEDIIALLSDAIGITIILVFVFWGLIIFATFASILF